MYKIYIDGELAYYPGDEELVILEPELELELNDAGAFEFSLPELSPFYGRIQNRVTMVQVLKDEKEIFYGEVRDYSKDSYNAKRIYCVGELSYLFDSIQRPAKYQNYTPRQMLEAFLNVHNAYVEDRKKFQVGIVTVRDQNNSLYRFTNNETTLDAIREKLVESLGGYLRVRKVEGVRYLDWINLSEYGKICQQPIKFGVNMLDYSENTTSDDLYTALIPYGVRQEESKIEGLQTYLDITAVNEGKDYVYLPEAVERYGWITAVEHWDDVTLPENLKTKAEKWLIDNQYENMVLELDAVDLSVLYSQFDSFELGDSVQALAEPYGMNRFFPVQKLKIYLKEPDKNTITLGNTVKKSFVQQGHDTNKNITGEIEKVQQTNSVLESAIENATQMLTGTKGGYRLDEFDEDGLFLRTLYMDAPSKETAVNLVQLGPQGIGFSNSGYAGPYKNAWTIGGVLNAEFITAGKLVGIEVDVTGKMTAYSSTRRAVFDEAKLEFYTGDTKTGSVTMDRYTPTEESKRGLSVSALNTVSVGLEGTWIPTAEISVERGEEFPVKILEKTSVRGTLEIANGSNNPTLSFRKSNVGDNTNPYMYKNGYYDGSIHVMLTEGTGNAFRVHGNMVATGTKNRSVRTDTYGAVLMNALESCEPLFEDYGHAALDSTGVANIILDPVFVETIEKGHYYYVFLQVCSDGKADKIEKKEDYFIVRGTPGTKFDWQVVATQRGYSSTRTEQDFTDYRNPDNPYMYEVYTGGITADYEQEATDYLKESSGEEENYITNALQYLDNYEKEILP